MSKPPARGKRPKAAIDASLANHVHMIKRVAEDEFHAIELIDELEGDIEQRIRDYTKCISKTTDNYRQWLIDEYNRKLRQELRQGLNNRPHKPDVDTHKTARPFLTDRPFRFSVIGPDGNAGPRHGMGLVPLGRPALTAGAVRHGGHRFGIGQNGGSGGGGSACSPKALLWPVLDGGGGHCFVLLLQGRTGLPVGFIVAVLGLGRSLDSSCTRPSGSIWIGRKPAPMRK